MTGFSDKSNEDSGLYGQTLSIWIVKERNYYEFNQAGN